jgi:hypothetical protein
MRFLWVIFIVVACNSNPQEEKKAKENDFFSVFLKDVPSAHFPITSEQLEPYLQKEIIPHYSKTKKIPRQISTEIAVKLGLLPPKGDYSAADYFWAMAKLQTDNFVVLLIGSCSPKLSNEGYGYALYTFTPQGAMIDRINFASFAGSSFSDSKWNETMVSTYIVNEAPNTQKSPYVTTETKANYEIRVNGTFKELDLSKDLQKANDAPELKADNQVHIYESKSKKMIETIYMSYKISEYIWEYESNKFKRDTLFFRYEKMRPGGGDTTYVYFKKYPKQDFVFVEERKPELPMFPARLIRINPDNSKTIFTLKENE